MNKAIVTYAAGAHEELLDISKVGYEAFADKHGYDFHIGSKMTDLPPAWNKVFLLGSLLSSYDQVIWLDCDLIIVDPNEDFPELKVSHSLVRHFEALSEVPNSGVWIITNAIKPLLEAMLNLPVFTNHGWWEQAALMTLMGYSVPAEGSNFSKTKCRCVYPTYWHKNCQFMRLPWNSHPNYRADKPKIVHCSYPNMLERIEVMHALIKDPAYNYPTYSIQENEKRDRDFIE